MKTTIWVTVVVSIIAIVMPLAAHHAFSAQYDLNKPMYMDGKVTRVRWSGPHVSVFMDVADKTHGVVNWQIDLASQTDLLDAGWKSDTLRSGMEICVQGYPAKDGKHVLGSSKTLTVKSTGEVLLNIGSMWRTPAYTGKDPCSNQGSR